MFYLVVTIPIKTSVVVHMGIVGVMACLDYTTKQLRALMPGF
jgi:hypothetical protein